MEASKVGAGSEPLDNLPGSLIFFVGVRPRKIEIELVGLRFGEEFAAAGEGFQIEELIFDQTMYRFHIALIGVRGGRAALIASDGYKRLSSHEPGRNSGRRPCADFIGRARPGSSPLRRAAPPKPKYESNSFTRFGLIHFNSARGIR